MNKPIAIVMSETSKQLVDVLNNSDLPYCILDALVRDLYQQVEDCARKEYIEAKKEYEKETKADDVAD